ncbi:MAG: lipoprotein insertase outer membrane protein LolB [Pseudomonadota bacterium]
MTNVTQHAAIGRCDPRFIQPITRRPGPTWVSRRRWYGWLTVGVVLLLGAGGCQSLPADPDTPLSYAQRARLLDSLAAYEASGRLSFTTQTERQSASFSLVVDGKTQRLQLSGPFGVGAVRIETANGRGRLISARHGDIVLDNVERELNNLLGYPVPIDAIRYWALGLPQPGVPADPVRAEAGRLLQTLTQAGWRVEFEQYQPVYVEASVSNRPRSRVDMPRKVRLHSADVRILMVFRDWAL